MIPARLRRLSREGRVLLLHPGLFTTGGSQPKPVRRLSPGSQDVVDNAARTSPQAGPDPSISKEVPGTTPGHARVAGSLFALVAIVASTIPSAVAQDATPVAQLAAPARPAHIHSGDCVNLGDVVVPLSDLTAPVSEG